jgi:hypothetical protein
MMEIYVTRRRSNSVTDSMDESPKSFERPRLMIHDARMWLAGGSAALSALIAVVLLLHTFGVFGYETRISVLESNTSSIDRSLHELNSKVDKIVDVIIGKK